MLICICVEETLVSIIIFNFLLAIFFKKHIKFKLCPNIGVIALDGLLYVVGGDDGASNLASIEIYNPNTNTWSMLTASMNIGRSYAGVVVIDKPPHFNS